MGDLKNPKLIIAKGFLFLGLGLFASALLLMHAPTVTVAVLLTLTVWAFCRFYYFAFYVIEHYVDSQYRFSGILHAVRYSLQRLSAKKRGITND